MDATELNDRIAKWAAKLWTEVYVEYIRKGSVVMLACKEADIAVAEFTKRFTVKE